MSQYAIIIYSDPTADHDAAEIAEHEAHAAELIGSGALDAAFALAPPATARSVRGDGVTDGPYTESKELIAGFCVVEAADLDAALAIAHRNPATWHGAGVEVREIEGAYLRGADTVAG